MKIIITFLAILLFTLGADSKESIYTASTPASPVVRTFLGIPLTDSIDFIRWKLSLSDNRYSLQCNYGIGKPNTNGFYDGGKNVSFSGVLTREEKYYRLSNGNQSLILIKLNSDLLHILNAEHRLLAGNGGWSYTLNNIKPEWGDQLNITSVASVVKDSMVFEGRTPCGVPGIITPGVDCYKLKWLITFYAGVQNNKGGNYRIWGTPWYKEGGKRGTWEITANKKNRIVYHLNDTDGHPFVYLLKAAENILLFTDADGKLLTGNEDFSYTLNRRL